MAKFGLKYSALILLAALLYACSGGKKVAEKEYDLDNDYFEYPFQRNVAIYHVNKDTTRFYVEVNNKDLLYAKDESGKFTAQFLFEVLAFSESGTLVDSSVLRIVDDKANLDHMFIAQTDLAMGIGNRYEVKMVTADLNRNVGISGTWEIVKESPWSRYNFLLIDPIEEAPVLSPYFTAPQTVHIKARQDTNRLTVNYYNREFPLPPPPFANYSPDKFDYAPDSSNTIALQSDSLFHLKLTKQGMYHLQTNASEKDGMTVFMFDGIYPEISKPKHMLPPLRYLLSSDEYEQLQNSSDTRQAIEDFWIRRSGDKEKARENIELYYTRVKQANEHYTSYVPGWKTDRGMIHIVFGKPNIIKRQKYGERWVYGEENNPNSITFDFVKVQNPFTSNDYRLDRDEIYKPVWYRTVDSWRGGRPLLN